MAIMYPQLDASELRDLEKKSQAEADVYRAFRDRTPAHWLVLHGHSIIWCAPGAPPRDGEADFVVFDPSRGFLVIEIKGGHISRDVNGKWWSVSRGGRRNRIKNPLEQACANKHHVARTIRRASGWGPDGAPHLLIGHGALFPNLESVVPLIASDRPKEILGDCNHVDNLVAWVEGAFEYWAKDDTSWQPLDAIGMTIVKNLYCAAIATESLLALAIRREQVRQIELTKRQALVLQYLRHRTRALITGAAGTGKTLLALQHAKALAEQGRKTLLVCYNRALGDFLKREAVGVTNLETMDFDELCMWRINHVMREKRIDLLDKATQRYPNSDLAKVRRPYALALSTSEDPMRYQAILVDEGQDFKEERWFALELLLENHDAQFYFFCDPNQAIYEHDISFPNLGDPLPLIENCRNTRPVHEAAYRYYKGDLIAPPEIEGEPITQIIANGLKAQAAHIRDTVSQLIGPLGLKSEDIAVLLAGDDKDMHFSTLLNGGDPIGARWSFEKLWQPGCVLVDTVRRFKGLEATAVIVWCAENVDSKTENELLYVALSRARNRLWLVGSSPRVAKVLRGM